MPNRVALLRADIEAAHPGARLRHRGEAGFSMRLPSGVEEHRYTTGPWHWKAPTDADWNEIDTDLEARPDPKWTRGIRSARFDTLIAEDGSRRFVPRRWLPDEWVEFGPPQWKAANWTTPVLGTGELRGENSLRGQGNRLCFDRPTHGFEVGFNGRGCRTSLILKSASVARPLRWKVTLNGLDLKDGVLVSLSDGERVGFIRPPSWTDASEDRTPREIPWEYGGGYVTLTPDLKDAQFPVVVDPDYSIAATGDDGHIQAGTIPAFSNNLTQNYVGHGAGAPYHEYHTFYRFAGIAATQAQDCTAASITVYWAASSTSDILSTFYGVDEDDHTAPTTYNEWNTDHGIHTTASTAWDITANKTAGGSDATPDLSGIFDELFGRANWQTGYDVGIHWDSSTTGSNLLQQPASYDNTTYTEPVLSLTLAAGTVDDQAEPATLSTASTFPAPTTGAGSSVSPAVLATVATFLAVTLGAGASASPATLQTAASFPAVTVQAGQQTSPATLQTAASFPAPTTAGGVSTAPDTLATTASFPAVTTGAGGSAAPDPLATTAGFPAPTVAGSSRASPDPLTTAASYPAPTTAGAGSATPDPLATTAAFPAPTTGAGSAAAPGPLATAATFPIPTTAAGAAASPDPLATAAGFPAPTTGAGTSANPDPLSTAASFPAVATAAGSTASPATLTTTAGFPAPTIGAGAAATPDPLATAASFPAATAQASQQTTPTTLETAAAFPAPTTSAGSSAAPATLQTVAAFPPPTLGTSASTAPDPLQTAATFPAATAHSGASARPATFHTAAAFPAPTFTAGQSISVSTLQTAATFPPPTARMRLQSPTRIISGETVSVISAEPAATVVSTEPSSVVSEEP